MPTISTKFVASGDKEYRNALKEINTNLSVLRSEMKKATEEFDLNEDAAAGLADQHDILDRTLKELAEKLETQEKRWKELTEQYGEADTRTKRLKASMNDTAAEMAKTEKAIKRNEEALEDYGKEADNAEDKSKSLGDVVTDLADRFGVDLPGGLDDTLGALKDVDAGMAGFAGVLAGVGASIAGLAADTAEWAQELEKQSDITGLSVESLQLLDNLAVRTGADYDQLIDGTKDLAQKMTDAANGNGEAAASFERLGVSVTNSEGELRSIDEVFWDVVSGLYNMEEGADRDAIAMELMGESARSLNPILNESADTIRQVVESTKFMSEETISNMNDMTRGAESALDKLKDSFRRAFGEIGDLIKGESSRWDMSFSLAAQSGRIGRNAHGTDYWPGGLTWVGEHGPELVNLPAGASVTPAAQAGGDTFNVNINASNIKELNDLVRIAENARVSQRMGYTGR